MFPVYPEKVGRAHESGHSSCRNRKWDWHTDQHNDRPGWELGLRDEAPWARRRRAFAQLRNVAVPILGAGVAGSQA